VGCKGWAEIAMEIQEERSSPRWNLVQIVVEAPAIRGDLPNTEQTQPVFGTVHSVLVDYREGLDIRTVGYKLCCVEEMAFPWRS